MGVSRIWLPLFALACFGLAGCGGGDDGDHDGSVEDGNGQDGGADEEQADCQTYADCALIKDCRCNDGYTNEGRSCIDGVCAERNEFCVDTCADQGGWIPNPEGCWYWELRESVGTGEDYRSARDGCLSGARIWVYRPGSFEEQNGFTWCIPQTQCDSDADCPSAAESPTGVAFRCHPPVTGIQTGNALRLCMDEEDTLCNMR